MVTFATLPLSTVPVTVMLSDSVVSSRVVRTAPAIAGSAPPARAQEAPDAEAQCRSRQGRHQGAHAFLVNRNDRSLFHSRLNQRPAFPIIKPFLCTGSLQKKMVNKKMRKGCVEQRKER